MILDKFVYVNITVKNITFFKEKGLIKYLIFLNKKTNLIT